MHDKFANTSGPRTPRCLICAQPMQLLRRTSRFGELPDLYSFYCYSCDEWHVEEGDAVAGPLSNLGSFASLGAIRH